MFKNLLKNKIWNLPRKCKMGTIMQTACMMMPTCIICIFFFSPLPASAIKISTAPPLTSYQLPHSTAGIKAATPQNLKNGLVGWWMLNSLSGVATDLSGQNNNGAALGGITIGGVVDEHGQARSATNFDGALNYAGASSTASLNFDTGFVTQVAWIKTADVGGTTRRSIVSKTDDTFRGYYIDLQTTGKLQGTISQDGTNYVLRNSASAVNDGKWHFVAYVGKGLSDAGDIYIDGVLNNGTTGNTGTPTTASNTHDFWIGNNTPNLSGSKFLGSIADVRIYGRSLSASEILQLYNSYRPTIKISSAPPITSFQTPHSTTSIQMATPQNLKNGLVGWWMLNGLSGANDLSGQNNNGTAQGGVNIGTTTDQHGMANGATNFDGAAHYVSLASNPISNYANPSSFCGWVKFRDISATSGGFTQKIMASFTDGSNYMSISNSGGTIYVTYRSGGTGYGDSANGVFSNNNWVHVCYTWDGSSRVKMYKNATLLTTTTGADGGLSVTFNAIGARSATTGLFGGSLDDVRIYNRALSATEITQLYNSYRPTVSVGSLEKGLVGHWMLDNITKAKDMTPYGNHGSAQGGIAIGTASDQHSQPNRATSFDGVSNYLNLGSGSSLSLVGPMTISAWVRSDKSNNGMVSEKDTGGNNYNWEFGWETGPNFYFGTYNGSWHRVVYNWESVGVWHHIVGTYDRQNFTLYIDGVKVGTPAAYTSNLATNAGFMSVGENYNGGTVVNMFKGAIDDVRVYNRALSSAEVQRLYNSYRP